MSLPLQLYQNDVRIKNDTIDFISGEAKFEDLPFGKYSFRFKSIYDIEETFEFEIKNKTQEITLCIDNIDYELVTNSLLIDQLKPYEKLKIDFQSHGCFHSENTRLEIIRTDERYLAKIEETEIVLSNTQFELVREFEIELRELTSGGYCTTFDTYNLTISKNSENIKLIDGWCIWNGFINLLEKLGLENNYS